MSEVGPDLEQEAAKEQKDPVEEGVKQEANTPKKGFKTRAKNLALAAGIGALRMFNLADDPINAAIQVLPPPPHTQDVGEKPTDAVVPYQVKVIDTQRQEQQNKAAGSTPPPNPLPNVNTPKNSDTFSNTPVSQTQAGPSKSV